LTESGLEVALATLVDRSYVPARLDMRLRAEPRPSVSAAAYFAVSEALTNVAKHAHATDVLVEVADHGDMLHILVTDNGVGGADPRVGSGLRGLNDRVEAAGGALSITSPPVGGTRLEVELPCG
jgi:signal transduction histidine kinase